MNCVTGMSVLGGAILLSAPALAADPSSQSASKQQLLVQLVGCVKKQHADDKGVSYQQAIKLCKAMQNNKPVESASEESAALAKQ
jgi:hypothetical protein